MADEVKPITIDSNESGPIETIDITETDNNIEKSTNDTTTVVENNINEPRTRLIVIYDGTRYQYTQTQIEDLKGQYTEVTELNDIQKDKEYYYLNLCIEYNEDFETILRSYSEIVNDEAWISKFKEIGFHITFDSNKQSWNEFETEKTEYFTLMDNLKKVKSKVTQISIIDKYDISVASYDNEESQKLVEEIQQDIEPWECLDILDYGNNHMTSLKGIKFPEKLRILNIGGGSLNTLEDIELPNNLTSLICNNNSITSIDNVKFPPSLKTLNLQGNHLYFLNYVDWPKNLEHLDISNNRIDNIRNIEFPSSLKLLNISFNPIDNLKGCKFPDNLHHLDISFIPNESMTGIKFPDYLYLLNLQQSMTNTRGLKLPNLVKILNLGGNGVNSINPLKLPNSIEYLNLNNNNIKTLNKVIFPSNLKKLFIGNNLITTLKNVVFPQSLDELNIEMDPELIDNDKRISNLKDVIFPSNLEVLNLSYQAIKTIESLEFPLSLKSLDLSFNELKLLRNVDFGNIRSLNISGNQELIEIDQISIPPTLLMLMIPSQLMGNLPGYIIERANNRELEIMKSLPFEN